MSVATSGTSLTKPFSGAITVGQSLSPGLRAQCSVGAGALGLPFGTDAKDLAEARQRSPPMLTLALSSARWSSSVRAGRLASSTSIEYGWTPSWLGGVKLRTGCRVQRRRLTGGLSGSAFLKGEGKITEHSKLSLRLVLDHAGRSTVALECVRPLQRSDIRLLKLAQMVTARADHCLTHTFS